MHCASAIDADKLVLFGAAAGVYNEEGDLIRQCAVGDIDALSIGDTEQASLLQCAKRACLAGVARCQIISYEDDCALLQELFTHDGGGTLVANDEYELLREANIDDVGGILELIEPLNSRVCW